MNVIQKASIQLTILFLIIITKSISSYAFDLFYNHAYAIKNANYLFLYLIMNTYQAWCFLIIMILFHFIFKNLTEKKYLLFKFIFALIISALYARYFYMDDYSLTIGKVKEFKLFLTCTISSALAIAYSDIYTTKLAKDKNL